MSVYCLYLSNFNELYICLMKHIWLFGQADRPDVEHLIIHTVISSGHTHV